MVFFRTLACAAIIASLVSCLNDRSASSSADNSDTTSTPQTSQAFSQDANTVAANNSGRNNGKFIADKSPVTFVNEAGSYGVSLWQRPSCTCSVMIEDYDSDGRPDIFLGNHGEKRKPYFPDQLLKSMDDNNPPLFENITNIAFSADGKNGPLEPRAAEGALFADIDNDGANELFILSGTGDHDNPSEDDLPDTAYRGVKVQAGIMMLVEETEKIGISNADTIPCGIAMLDIDRDGFIDLFRQGHHGQFVFLNTRDGKLADITEELGLHEEYDGDAMGISTADFDLDGDLDVFVGLGQEDGTPGRNILFVNSGKKQWIDIAHDVGLDDQRSSFSSAWGDLDNDGDPDLYVANNAEFDPDPMDAIFLNKYKEEHKFIATDPAIYEVNKDKSTTVVIADMDNDGWQDIIVAGPNTKKYLKGIRDGIRDVSEGSGLSGEFPTYAMAVGDVNNDGFLDILCGNMKGKPNELYINKGNSNNWLKIRLVGRGEGGTNFNGIGARIELETKGHRQTRWIAPSSPGNYLQMTVHFGLGLQRHADKLVVYWTNGRKTIIRDTEALLANRTVTVREEGD